MKIDNSKKLLVITCLILLSTIACSSKSTKDYLLDVTYTPKTVTIDSNTVRNNEEETWITELNHKVQIDYESSKEDGYNMYDHGGEIIIENQDNSTNWELDGNDIIYRGITYHDLYSNVSQINPYCGTNTFINFIIKTYLAKEKDIYTMVSIESNEVIEIAEGEDYTNISLDEILYDNPKYTELKERYNSVCTWMLEICTWGGKNKGIIAGNSDYMLFINTDEDITIDMSSYDFSDLNTTETNVDDVEVDYENIGAEEVSEYAD